MNLWIVLCALATAGTPSLHATASVTEADLWIPKPTHLGGTRLSRQTIEACASGTVLAQDHGLVTAVVEVSPTELRFGGELISPLEAGRFSSAALEGQRVEPLYKVLTQSMDELRRTAKLGCTLPTLSHGAGRALIVANGTVPFGTLYHTLHNLKQAGFGSFDFRVDAPAPTGPPLSTEPQLQQTTRKVAIDGGGFTLWIGSQRTKLPCPSDACSQEDDLDFAGLGALLAASSEQGHSVVMVVPNAEVPWSTVLRTLSAIVVDPGGRTLFPNVLLAGATYEEAPIAVSWTGQQGQPSPTLPKAGAPVIRSVLPSLTPLKETSGQSFVLGSLDRDQISGTIAKELTQIRKCYLQQLKQHPDLEGELRVGFFIEADGSTSHIRVVTDTIGLRPFTDCVLSRFEKLKFPEPRGNGIVRVNYPLTFSP